MEMIVPELVFLGVTPEEMVPEGIVPEDVVSEGTMLGPV